MIRITINGPIASGKTTIGTIIERALEKHGYIVERYLEAAREPPSGGYLEVQMEETNVSMRNA